VLFRTLGVLTISGIFREINFLRQRL